MARRPVARWILGSALVAAPLVACGDEWVDACGQRFTATTSWNTLLGVLE